MVTASSPLSCCLGDGAVLGRGGVPGQPVHLLDHRKHLGSHVSLNMSREPEEEVLGASVLVWVLLEEGCVGGVGGFLGRFEGLALV